MNGSSDKWARLAALKPPPRQALPAHASPAEPGSIAELLGAQMARNRFGHHLAVRRWFSTPEFFQPSSCAAELLARTGDADQARAARTALQEPSRWLFLDTETTGLAGGAGTYAFLIGIAWWDSGGLQVEQFFMRDFTDEHSILQELAARLVRRPVLFSFNGKCFDWPLLETRFRMTRAIPAPRLAAHFDLLHPARALWKLRLGSVRLVELERSVLGAARLGWDRREDVDSALIPQLYFDYLRGGSAHPLSAVLRHNQMDLRGLAALLGEIAGRLDGTRPQASGEDEALDLYGLARFLDRRGEPARARCACQVALDAGLPAAFRSAARWKLARLAKRAGDFAQAIALWEGLTAEPSHCLAACEELAIHCERRARDFQRALEYTRLGLARVRLRNTGYDDPPILSRRFIRLEERWEKRLARLEHRLRNAGAVASSFKELPRQLARAEKECAKPSPWDGHPVVAAAPDPEATPKLGSTDGIALRSRPPA